MSLSNRAEQHPMDQPDSRDRSIFLNNFQDGAYFAKVVKFYLERVGAFIKEDPVFLGVGVGAARAELGFSSVFGASTIHLVDKHDRAKIIVNSVTDHNMEQLDINFLKTGIFEYLQSLPQKDTNWKKYVEYVLRNLELFKQVLLLLSKVVKKNGFVFVFPSDSLDQNIDFSEFGFEDLSTDSALFFALHKK